MLTHHLIAGIMDNIKQEIENLGWVGGSFDICLVFFKEGGYILIFKKYYVLLLNLPEKYENDQFSRFERSWRTYRQTYFIT